MKIRSAFTMIELVFVIVILGIIGKFGIEFLAQTYKSFLYTNVNHHLQSKSEIAVEIIAKRLEHRIKDSVIARTSPGSTPVPIGSASGESYTVLEWVGVDNEGFRGTILPYWSGIIDLNNCSASVLTSPDTNTTAENTLIKIFSEDNSTDINDTAIYFVGSNSDAVTDYGWNGDITYMNAQRGAMHPINSNSNISQFVPASGTSDFSGVDVYEYYKLARTAYAVVIEDYNNTGDNTGTLKLYYNYQPWKDKDSSGSSDQLNDAPNVKSAVIMDKVSTFRFMSIGSIMKIQVCVKSDVLQKDGGDYSLCKEKTIF